MVPPALAIGRCSRPFPVHALPTYWSLLRAEFRFAEVAAAVAIGLTAAKQSLEHLGLRISAIRAEHGGNLLS